MNSKMVSICLNAVQILRYLGLLDLLLSDSVVHTLDVQCYTRGCVKIRYQVDSKDTVKLVLIKVKVKLAS